jgi:hypothetical protein
VSIALALGVVLAVACVLLVARPFLREPAPESDLLDEPGSDEQERIALAEERDRALAALKELEFDHRTGKVSDADYRALVGPLRRRAAELLRALEAAEAPVRVRANPEAVEPPVRVNGPEEGVLGNHEIPPGDSGAHAGR